MILFVWVWMHFCKLHAKNQKVVPTISFTLSVCAFLLFFDRSGTFMFVDMTINCMCVWKDGFEKKLKTNVYVVDVCICRLEWMKMCIWHVVDVFMSFGWNVGNEKEVEKLRLQTSKQVVDASWLRSLFRIAMANFCRWNVLFTINSKKQQFSQNFK